MYVSRDTGTTDTGASHRPMRGALGYEDQQHQYEAQAREVEVSFESWGALTGRSEDTAKGDRCNREEGCGDVMLIVNRNEWGGGEGVRRFILLVVSRLTGVIGPKEASSRWPQTL